MITPLPSASRIYSIPLQEEGHRTLNSGSTTSLAIVVNTPYSMSRQPGYNNSFQDRKRLVLKCKRCGFNGHTIDKCFRLIGYPPNWVVLKEGAY